MLTPEKLNHLIAPMFPGLMGVRVIDATPQRVRAELTVRPDLCTAGGILHGGAYMAFADALGAAGDDDDAAVVAEVDLAGIGCGHGEVSWMK